MAGDKETTRKGELFDLLSEDEPLKLTAMTRLDWGSERSLVDAVLFAVADGAKVSEAAEAVGASVQQASAWIKKADEPELAARNRHSD